MKSELEKAASIMQRLNLLNKTHNLGLHVGPMASSLVQRSKKWLKENKFKIYPERKEDENRN